MSNDLIQQARRRYLAANPLRRNSIPAVAAGGAQTELVIPNLGDIQTIGCKLGMEYLAICHDDDAVEEWISDAISIAKDPETVGILLANVLRGVNVVIGELIDREQLRNHFERLAVEAWNRDFGGEQ